MQPTTHKILLLLSPSEGHPFDPYLEEIFLIEGYNGYERRVMGPGVEAPELSAFPVAVISSGAAARLDAETVRKYVAGGGRAVILKPPRDWAPLFGLAPAGPMYSVARDAYLRVNVEHPWLQGFPAADLQVPGEAHVYPAESAETLAFVAGQRGRSSVYPAVALWRHGEGAAVVFTYDLAETVVLLHQGRPEKSSTGTDPDANRDGKFTGDDAFEGMRDYELRHVPQADVHQDLLVRVLRGLTEGVCPLPRLWHFPHAAPAVVFIDGDGDSMVWEDLEWVVREAAETGTKYTLYLMTEQIEAFDPGRVAALREQGHEFGIHPWVSPQPDPETWRQCVADIVTLFRQRFGFLPRSMRAHSSIFPGWDETPRMLVEQGVRMETSFCGGYRFVSGYLNGSALPVKFISRDGQVLDCYEQSTVQTEDGSCTPKNLLPPMTENEALQLALELLHDCVQRWHGVFHPYFHPIHLAGRDIVACQTWFRELLRATRALGLPSVNASEWLDFNDARRSVAVRLQEWNGKALTVQLEAPVAMQGLTLLLPPWRVGEDLKAVADGSETDLLSLGYEGLQWLAVVMDLPAEKPVTVRVGPES